MFIYNNRYILFYIFKIYICFFGMEFKDGNEIDIYIIIIIIIYLA